MLGNVKVFISNAIYVAKQRVGEKVRNASGMEMLQMVLIIGVAVVIAGGMFVFLKSYMPTFWANIQNKMNAILGSETSLGGSSVPGGGE